MKLYDAVRDTLAADPAILRIEPRAELQIGQAGPLTVVPAPMRPGEWIEINGVRIDAPSLCKCCTTNSAFKGGYCYECAEHNEAEAKRLRDLLARALPHVQWAHGSYPSTFRRGWMEGTQELIRDIEAEIGADDE